MLHRHRSSHRLIQQAVALTDAHARHFRAELTLMHTACTAERNLALLLVARVLEALVSIRTACCRDWRQRYLARMHLFEQFLLHIAQRLGARRSRRHFLDHALCGRIAIVRMVELYLVVARVAILATRAVAVHRLMVVIMLWRPMMITACHATAGPCYSRVGVDGRPCCVPLGCTEL